MFRLFTVGVVTKLSLMEATRLRGSTGAMSEVGDGYARSHGFPSVGGRGVNGKYSCISRTKNGEDPGEDMGGVARLPGDPWPNEPGVKTLGGGGSVRFISPSLRDRYEPGRVRLDCEVDAVVDAARKEVEFDNRGGL